MPALSLWLHSCSCLCPPSAVAVAALVLAHYCADMTPASTNTPADAPLDAVAIAQLVADGQTTALEQAEQAIKRCESVNSQINAVVRTTFDQALGHARELAEQEPASGAKPAQASGSGRLAGVPFVTKDLHCVTAGEPHYMGNAALKDADYRAPQTSYLATMLRELGMVNLGYTNTPEFGLTVTTEPLSYGPTANPWNLEYSAGGSSGGSAAAVAAGIVPIAQGGDGGGSIRIPAANNGIFGLKPSRGRVSPGPASGEGWAGASINGVMSRTVRDTAVALDGICRPWPGDPYWAPPPSQSYESQVGVAPEPLRIGLCPHSGWGDVDAQCVQAVEDAGKLLEGLGHQVDYSMPERLFDEEFRTYYGAVVAPATAKMLDDLGAAIGRPFTRDDVEGDTWALAEVGRTISGTQYLTGLTWIHSFTRAMLAWWGEHDVLVCPVMAEPPPKLGELRDPDKRDRLSDLLHFTAQFNVTGQPGMSVPLHWTPEQLPVGVQFVGAQCTEAQLLRLAGQLEQAAPWAHRRPPVWAQ